MLETATSSRYGLFKSIRGRKLVVVVFCRGKWWVYGL